MTVRQHILPPATTPLERAWDETLPAWGELADAFKTPSEGEPAAFVPWYAAEYGLAEFAPYFDTVPELLAEGLPWLFVRGTAAGVALALRWVGFAGAVAEESGARLLIMPVQTGTGENTSTWLKMIETNVRLLAANL